MKRCRNITGWTDYPFEALGDKPGEIAPIRQVNVLSYDGNKYVKVSFKDSGDVETFKAGYLYGQRGRCGQVPAINRRKLERMLPKESRWTRL